jgi:hypothetical protein
VNSSPFLAASRTFQDVDVQAQPELFSRIINKFSEDVSVNVNTRTIGIYSNVSSPIGNSFFGINILRVVAQFSSLASGYTVLPTDITPSANIVVTALYGIAQSTADAVPIPYVNPTTPSDSVSVALNLGTGYISIITTTSNWTSFSGFVCVEYGYN